ncbi:MAG: AAA family ATPase [Actinomycetes bacterium]
MLNNLPYDDLLARLTKETLELVDSGVNTPIVVIDGRAGSGKSTLAAALQNALFLEGESLPRLIHMEDLYEGWTGLAQGAEYLQRIILMPLFGNKTASWQEYNWELNQRDRWREFSGGTPLIIEGCGSLNRYTANVSNINVWLDVPEEIRRARWLERDGHVFDEYFDSWAAQELDFIAREKSPEWASYGLVSPTV